MPGFFPSGQPCEDLRLGLDRSDTNTPGPPQLPPSEAAAARRPKRPRVIDVAHGFWMLSCLAGVITAVLSLRHFDE